MTYLEIEERVKAIKYCSDDNEQAHVMEDILCEEVLCAIANGAPNPAALAAAALKTRDIEFDRWYA